MDLLTRDQLTTMTCDELCALEYEHVYESVRDLALSYVEEKALMDALAATLQPRIQPHVDAWITAYSSKRQDVKGLVEAFDKEPSIVKIMTWCKLTQAGAQELERARFVHKHLVWSVLSAFGQPVG